MKAISYFILIAIILVVVAVMLLSLGSAIAAFLLKVAFGALIIGIIITVVLIIMFLRWLGKFWTRWFNR